PFQLNLSWIPAATPNAWLAALATAPAATLPLGIPDLAMVVEDGPALHRVGLPRLPPEQVVEIDAAAHLPVDYAHPAQRPAAIVH
ncbi:hypothetical protein, partial [Escherichia coli]|uniref:hypothetical protein n=1 Tax=Escherichia coli TaxID=562 RepID=UPI001BE48E02